MKTANICYELSQKLVLKKINGLHKNINLLIFINYIFINLERSKGDAIGNVFVLLGVLSRVDRKFQKSNASEMASDYLHSGIVLGLSEKILMIRIIYENSQILHYSYI